jgi:hypothetical protein
MLLAATHLCAPGVVAQQGLAEERAQAQAAAANAAKTNAFKKHQEFLNSVSCVTSQHCMCYIYFTVSACYAAAMTATGLCCSTQSLRYSGSAEYTACMYDPTI